MILCFDDMTNVSQIIPVPEQFSDIAPYSDLEFNQKLSHLVKEPGFEHAVKYAMPSGMDYPAYAAQLLQVHSQNEFQQKIMWPFLEMLAKRTTMGITIGGLDNIRTDCNYTFLTNHRDIVLDASFLNLNFLRNGLQTTEIAIGNNLLIYDWITDLVKLNKSFIVKRDVRMIEALKAAKQLSGYIHFAVTQKKQSIWVAQREGRAKDSNDLTQESLVKMLALGSNGSVRENLQEINITPVSISYELDPNDYLKAREFLMRRRNPEFRKSQRDDLFAMETGLMQQKGRVHFEVSTPISGKLAEFGSEDKSEVVKYTCGLIDTAINSGYHIFPSNYISYDEVNNCSRFKEMYSEKDMSDFDAYINGQLDKVDAEIADITAEERTFMRVKMLEMYANPLKNKLVATRRR